MTDIIEQLKTTALAPPKPIDVMIRQNRERVRDFLEALPPEQFNMRIWRGDDLKRVTADPEAPDWVKRYFAEKQANHCGTVGCIAGWGEIALGCSPGVDRKGDRLNHYQITVKMGLTDAQAQRLFFPGNLATITKAQAIRVLDILIETNEVDWPRAIAEA